MRFESMCLPCDAMRVVGFRIVVSISAGVLSIGGRDLIGRADVPDEYAAAAVDDDKFGNDVIYLK